VRKTVGRSPERHGWWWWWWWVDQDGHFDPAAIGPYGGRSIPKEGEDSEEGEAEDQLGHRRKCGGRTPAC
jgi:hypothetical protein